MAENSFCLVFEEKSNHSRRQTAQNQQPNHAPVFPEKPDIVLAKHSEHSQKRAPVQSHVKTQTLIIPAENVRHEIEVGLRRNRQKLGQSLDGTQNYGVENC